MLNLSAVPNGVVEYLRQSVAQSLGVAGDGSHVGRADDLKPPSMAGQWYVSVGQHSVRTIANSDAVDATHTLSVAVTTRLGWVPRDRRGDVQGHSFVHPNPTPAFAATGPATVERPDVQMGIDWLTGLCHDLLVGGDSELRHHVNHFLGLEASGDLVYPGDPETAVDVDPTYGVAQMFLVGQIGLVQSQGGEWVGARAGSIGAGELQVRVITMSGMRTITPTRYRRGLDRRHNFTA